MQQQEYIDSAHLIKVHANVREDEAKRQRATELQARAIEIREYEKRNDAEVKLARKAEVARKRNLHEAMEEAKLVPDAQLGKPDDPEQGPLHMFTRFFGFRKRGFGHANAHSAAQ